MEPADGTPERRGALPPRQTWYPARRHLHVALFVIFSAAMLALAFLRLTITSLEPGVRIVFAVMHAALAILPAYLALSASRSRLEADSEGLHIVQWPRTTTYRWADIAEIRPSIVKSRRTLLVLVPHHGLIVDLPVTEEHLGELRRWHESAG